MTMAGDSLFVDASVLNGVVTFHRHTGLRRYPGLVCPKDAVTWPEFLDSGFRRNDGGGWEWRIMELMARPKRVC